MDGFGISKIFYMSQNISKIKIQIRLDNIHSKVDEQELLDIENFHRIIRKKEQETSI